MTLSSSLLTEQSIGFKDWDVVCQAMGAGHQSVILRKGGLAEGRAGFQFKHHAFYLFPTQYHEQMTKVRKDALAQLHILTSPTSSSDLTSKVVHSPTSIVAIRYFFQVERACWVDNKETLKQLESFHIYTEEVIEERFSYNEEKQGAGITVAFGRTYALNPVWQFPDSPTYGGCKSWLEKLPSAPIDKLTLTPVLNDSEYQDLLKRFDQIIS